VNRVHHAVFSLLAELGLLLDQQLLGVALVHVLLERVEALVPLALFVEVAVVL